jgi:hypothetical protein
MHKVVIGFIPPVVGVDAQFNTFRMGRRYARLVEGEEVFLMDEKNKIVFGKAIVLDVSVGPVAALCAVYANENHTQLGANDSDCSERLYKVLEKIYGPHIVKPNRTATVIKLRRVVCEGDSTQGELPALRSMVRAG